MQYGRASNESDIDVEQVIDEGNKLIVKVLFIQLDDLYYRDNRNK